eukprot:CAMPEP_0205934670 /NCGR_PEP_ID=MMETSP1325-20131115/36938_1 /ASSEMBLY_ACC=CAM_ASM_000708 /TAXON_ID=236786 /ORGANISM="Florenciella sp., Strain RCC1007" /LENGTH=42 /DNA_ID= /DNA_START= /DNA_END= /DNA_ORIENTATION=
MSAIATAGAPPFAAGATCGLRQLWPGQPGMQKQQMQMQQSTM